MHTYKQTLNISSIVRSLIENKVSDSVLEKASQSLILESKEKVNQSWCWSASPGFDRSTNPDKLIK